MKRKVFLIGLFLLMHLLLYGHGLGELPEDTLPYITLNNQILRLNGEVYATYGNIAYGQPFGDAKNTREGKWHIQKNRPYIDGDEVLYRGEKRYLGYTRQGLPFANPVYPADSLSGKTLSDFSYVEVTRASQSWRYLPSLVRDYILGANLTADQVPGQINLRDIGGEDFGRIQQAPFWRYDGSILLHHLDSRGKQWYISLQIPRLNPYSPNELILEVNAPKEVVMTSEEDEVTLSYVGKAQLLHGRGDIGHEIAFISLGLDGQEKRLEKSDVIELEVEKILKRSDFGPGEHLISLDAFCSYETIFSNEDFYDGGQKSERLVTKLIIEEKEQATLTYQLQGEILEKSLMKEEYEVEIIARGQVIGPMAKEITKLHHQVGDKEFTLFEQKAFEEKFIIRAERTSLREGLKVWGKVKVTLADGRTLAAYGEELLKLDLPSPEEEVYLQVESPIKAGQHTLINLTSTGGELKEVEIYLPDAFTILQRHDYGLKGYWNQGGDYKVSGKGSLGGSPRYDQQVIRVLPPLLEQDLRVTGPLKENRLIHLESRSRSPEAFPIIETRWVLDEDLLHKPGVTPQEVYVVARQAGSYDVSLHEENSGKETASRQKLLAIEKDLPPIAQVMTVDKIYRNGQNGKARIVLFHQSRSMDHDELGLTRVSYQFDANNDGLFTEEWIEHEVVKNPVQSLIEVDQVGHYRVKVEVTEDFPIMEGLNDQVKPLTDQVIVSLQVDNLKPSLTGGLEEVNKISFLALLGSYDLTLEEVNLHMDQQISPLLREASLRPAYQGGQALDLKKIGLISAKPLITYQKEVTEKPYESHDGAYQAIVLKEGTSHFLQVRHVASGKVMETQLHGEGILPVILSIYQGKVAIGSGNRLTLYDMQKDLERISPAFTTYPRGGFGWVKNNSGYLYTSSDLYYCNYSTSPSGRFVAIKLLSTFSEDQGYAVVRVIDLARHELYTAGSERLKWVGYPYSISINDQGDVSFLVTDRASQDMTEVRYVLAGKAYKKTASLEKLVRNKKTYSYLDRAYPLIGTLSEHLVLEFVRGQGYLNYVVDSQSRVLGILRDINDNGVYIKGDQFVLGSNQRHFYDQDQEVVATHEDLGLEEGPIQWFTWGSSNDRFLMVQEGGIERRGILSNTQYGFQFDTSLSLIRHLEAIEGSDQYVIYYEEDLSLLEKPGKYIDQLLGVLEEKNLKLIIVTNDDKGEDLVDGSIRYLNGSSMTPFLLAQKITNLIRADQEPSYQEEAMITLVEEELNARLIYQDPEEDPLAFITQEIHHLDPSFFDLSEGLSAYHGLTQEVTAIRLDKPGLYEITLTATDQPSDKLSFAAYQKESEPLSLKVLAHRRPVAAFQATAYQNGFVIKDDSYDPDAYDQVDKGIKERHWSYRTSQDHIWKTGRPQATHPDETYYLRLVVWDVYGASSSITISCKGTNTPMPLELTGQLEPLDPSFSLSALPSSEGIVLKNLVSTSNEVHQLLISLMDEAGKEVLSLIKETESSLGSFLEDRFHWNQIPIILPSTLEDGFYHLVAKAKVGEEEASIDFDLVLNTPINLEATSELLDGALSLKAKTSTYVDEVWVDVFASSSYERRIPLKTTGIGEWSARLSLPDALPGGEYILRYQAKLPSGKIEEVSQRIHYQPMTMEEVFLEGSWKVWPKGRYLTHEELTITLKVTGEFDEIGLYFDPEWVAAAYTNSYGQAYRPEDFELTKLEQGMKLRKVKEGEYTISFIIPLVPWTLDYQDDFLRPAYKLRLVGVKGQSTIEKIIDPIEITGNIRDHLEVY